MLELLAARITDEASVHREAAVEQYESVVAVNLRLSSAALNCRLARLWRRDARRIDRRSERPAREGEPGQSPEALDLGLAEDILQG